MKKLFPILAVALLASAALSFAAPDPEANRQIKSLKNRATVTEAEVDTLQTEMDAVEAVAAAAIPAASFAAVDTNATVTVTTHTPAFRGQLLIGTASNLVWIAVGTTTNDWVAVVEPAE